jgi:phospholipid/cholesterol/gamma-HCH transport system substrate-binding protein
MRENELRNIIKVGGFVSILTFLFMVFIVSMGKEASLFDDKVIVKANIESAAGLKEGTFVQFQGIKVGFVTTIDLTDKNTVLVSIKINEKYLSWLRSDSKVSINTAGLVGDKFIAILPGSVDSSPFDPEKDVLLGEDDLSMKQIAAKGEVALEKVGLILGKLENILDRLDKKQSLTKTLDRMSSVLGKLDKSKTINSLDKIMSRIETGPGTLHSLIYDDVLHQDMRVLLGGAKRNSVIKYFIRQSIKNSESNGAK